MNTTPDVAPPEGHAASPPAPWGFWATLAWTLVVGALWFAAQVVATVAYVTSQTHAVAFEPDGLIVGLATLVAAPVAVGGFALAARLRGWRAADYLALEKPTRRSTVIGAVCLVLALPLFDALTWLSGRDVVHPFIVETYTAAREAGVLWLLVVAFVIAAPVTEEIAFRGFVYRGWAASWLGPFGTIVCASALWSALHTQYEPFFLVQIFALGLLLGWLRWRSGSVLLTIALHAVVNAAALGQAHLRAVGLI